MVVGGGRADAGGLWIDFLLLPELLEEHLERLRSGAASSPSHAELINMFLDQALSSYKLARKEPEASPRSDSSNRTSTLLCERAVRVVLAANFTLSDIESLVPKHLPLILKALIKFDRPRSLLHECDLRRWIIHRALAPDTLSAATTTATTAANHNKSSSSTPSPAPPPSSPSPSPAAGAGELSSSDFFQDANLLPVAEPRGDEGSAVAFLENVLEREKVLDGGGGGGGGSKQVNGLVAVRGEGGLELGFICKILFDVAEAHFMRGRIKRANELFTRCGEMMESESEPESADPVPRDRLNGFIVACRSVLGSGALQSGSMNMNASTSQEVVFTCETRRASLKRKSEECNGVTDRVKLPKPGPRENGGVEAQHKTSQKLPNGFSEETTGLQQEEGVEDLVGVLVGDLLPRRLCWPYCLSLESDRSLPAAVRLRVSACNVLRKVLEGGAFESFLRISYRAEEESREAGEFLLELMSKLVSRQEEDLKLASRVRQFCVFVCRALEQSWCWRLAVKQGLVSPELAGKLGESSFIDRDLRLAEVQPDAGAGGGDTSGLDVMEILQAESLAEVERVVSASPREGGDSSAAKLVRMRAFYAMEKQQDLGLARGLYALAKRLNPGNIDTVLYLWLIDRTWSGSVWLPEDIGSFDRPPTPGVIEFVSVKLLEARQWILIRELCSWAEEVKLMESEALGFLFKEVSLIGALVQLCHPIPSSNTGAIILKLEELMGLLRRESGCSRWFSVGVKTRLPIISRLSSLEALESLESLLAGWSKASSPVVDLARYNSLAPMASNSKARDSEFGRKVLEALLQRLLKLPARVPRQRNRRGCRCFLGLADLAFVDQAYLEALQLYLQAGAMTSRFYCDRVTSMARDVFTPWVITRMITACKEIGAQIQAAILCQCLPKPDYEAAFQILLANPLIVDHDVALYFECVWEIPLLELLLNMHSKAGDRSRVNILIGILQQPALNVHNPASIRKAHIAAMEQKFLQRFYAELI